MFWRSSERSKSDLRRVVSTPRLVRFTGSGRDTATCHEAPLPNCHDIFKQPRRFATGLLVFLRSDADRLDAASSSSVTRPELSSESLRATAVPRSHRRRDRLEFLVPRRGRQGRCSTLNSRRSPHGYHLRKAHAATGVDVRGGVVRGVHREEVLEQAESVRRRRSASRHE